MNHHILKSFIKPTVANELAHRLIAEEYYQVDDQCPHSKSFSNFLPFSKLQIECLSRVSEIVREPVLPTYNYSRIYMHGETLKRHTDREACEVTISINLARCCEWPLCLASETGEEFSIVQNPGDAVIYYGTVMPHWRDTYPGSQHIQVFLHYVRAEGPYAWAVFDKEERESQTAWQEQ